MLVKDVMNKNVKVAHSDMKITDAAKLMSRCHIGSLIIVDDKGDIIGILTERDIMVDAVAKGKSLKHILIENIMTKNVITISPDKKIEEAAEMMNENRIKRLPIVDDGKVLGIITASDIIAVQPKLMRRLKNLLSIETKTYTFKLKKSFYQIAKGKFNTIFGSFQVFLGIVSIIGAYLFFHQIEFLESILPSELLGTSIFVTLSVMGGLFLISGIFLLSLES